MNSKMYVARPEATEAQIQTAEELIKLADEYIKDKLELN